MRLKNDLETLLIHFEGFKHHPYTCESGKVTIGVGFNLTDDGLTDEEIMYLLRNRITRCKNELRQFDWYFKQPADVQMALIRMCYNLGLPRLLTFKKMIKALEEKNYTLAAKEALDSKWARQVHERAKDIAVQIREAETRRHDPNQRS